jgi:predicted PurR-regulated permease PerM
MSQDCNNDKNYAPVFVTEFAFGILFNELVDWLHKRGYERGITALLVVAGVAATVLIPFVIFGWRVFSFADIVVIFFGSGPPMVAGDWRRYIRQQEKEREGYVVLTADGYYQQEEPKEGKAQGRRGHLAR